MSASAPSVPPTSPTSSFDVERSLDRLRLRLVDATAHLSPQGRELSGPLGADLHDRVAAVMEELAAIQRDLSALHQVSHVEETGLSEWLEELDLKLANGWEPESSPVDEVVARLRMKLDAQAE